MHVRIILWLTVLLLSTHASANLPKGCAINLGEENFGRTLLSEVKVMGPRLTTECNVHQFAWNNFIYLISAADDGHPRFMHYTPWYSLFPKLGKPVWEDKFRPLDTMQLDKVIRQAGDEYRLLDVAGKPVRYDMRVNREFFDYVRKHELYKQRKIIDKELAFQKDSSKLGIWLPPNGKENGSTIEIKTAWRSYGPASLNACPKDEMHCEIDKKGNSYGLVGFHLVQKTKLHGEMIWASFEHIANAPDCSEGGSNPIQRYPQGELNSNNALPNLADKTGWSFFNYARYTRNGGDGKDCRFPRAGMTEKPLCLTSPYDLATLKWRSIDVCRTNPLPAISDQDCNNQVLVGQDGKSVACINKSVKEALDLDEKWLNYVLVGSEYVIWGATGYGANPVGCWVFTDHDGKIDQSYCSNKTDEAKVSLQGSTFLASTVMETWMQKNISLRAPMIDIATQLPVIDPKSKQPKMLHWTQKHCFSCHQPVTEQNFKTKIPFALGDMSFIFGRAAQ